MAAGPNPRAPRQKHTSWSSCAYIDFLIFQRLTHGACKRPIRRCRRTFRCSIPGRILEAAVSASGLDSDRTGQALNTGCLDRTPSLEHRSTRHRATCTAPEPFAPRMGEAARAPYRRSLNKNAKLAHAAAVSWGEIDTALPAQFTCRDTSEQNSSSAAVTAFAVAPTCSPDQLNGTPAATRTADHARRVSSGHRDFLRRAPRPRYANPRLDARCPCHVGPVR
jgi:hypothetical protein